MAQGLERIPLAVDSDFQAQPVRANFPEAPSHDVKLVSFEPDQAQAQPAPQARSLGTVTADTVYGMAKGAGSLAKGIGWLTGSDGLQQAGQDAEDYWGEKQSADLHRQLEAVGKAEGVSGTVASLWNNPGAIGDYIATSLPMMIPGMAVGNIGARGIVAYAGNAARGAALRAGATEAAAMQAGRIAAEKAAEKAALRFAVGANMLGEGAVSGGVTGAEVEKFAIEHGATPEQAKAAANKSALMAGAWTTAGAGIGAGMETRAMLGRLKDSGIKGMVKNVTKEAAEEAIQNPGEDYAAYAGKVQFDPTQTFDPGKAATLGAITGGAMGAGFHAAGRAGTIMRGEREDDNPDGAIPADDIGAGPGSGGPGAIDGEFIPSEPMDPRRGLSYAPPQGATYDQNQPTLPPGQPLLAGPQPMEGDVLGPESLPAGQALLGKPAIEGSATVQGGEFARPMLTAPEAGGPSDRQVSTAIGLLNHSPMASPELLQRLMRVDQDMAAMLFNHWQGQKQNSLSTNPMEASHVRQKTPEVLSDAGGVPPAITPLDVQAHAAATSPFNATPQPTEAQKQAGNYAKGHIKFQGMDISIENPAGSVRSGTDEDGKAWETQIQHHYGYIKGTVGKDKDHLDVFIKPGAQSARTAYVIDQIKPKTGAFDEHKIVFGADSESDAQAIYHANYEQGWQGMGAITAMPIEQFKDWIKSGKTKKPVAYTEPKEIRTASRAPKAASNLLQAIVNRGGINREIMSDVGADPAGRYMPGLFTKTGTTDLSALAGYLFEDDGFHQIRQDSPIGPARELEDLIVRAINGERILNTAAMEKGMQAEETAKLKEKAQRLGVKTVARKLEDIAADVLRIEAKNVLDEETALEDEALVAYNETVDALRSAYGDEDAEVFLEDLASKYQDATHLSYLRNATIDIQEKINAKAVQSASVVEQATASESGQGNEAGRAPSGDRASGEEARPALSLSGQSEAEIRAEQERVAAAEAQRKAEDERAAAAERQARIDAEVAGRQDVAADNFTLTPQVNNKTQQKKADQAEIDRQLAGQGDIFGAPANSEKQPADPVAESGVVVAGTPKRTSFGGHRAWDFGGVLVVGVKNPYAGGLSHFAFHLADGNGGWKRLEAVGDGLDGGYADGPGNPPSRQNIIRHLKERAVPVAESLAPAPSEPGDDGVATIQGGAAADIRNSQTANEPKKDAKGNPIYKMGDRVEYVSGGYAGRHGAISQVTPMTTTVLGLARDSGYYAQSQSTSYYYHVKTDNGADFMASPEEIRFETTKPASVVPDITVDGVPMEPRRVLDGIGYAKRSAEGSRAAAQRARKASAIADHKRTAERNDAKAEQYQAAWDAWAAKYPDEAEKIAPAAKQAATPAQSGAVASGSDPAAVLKAAGLIVTKGTTNNGKPVWNVSGNTKTHMDIIKRAGGRWYGPKKVWSFYNDDPSAAIAAKLPPPGPTIAGTPTIAMSDKGLQQIAASNQPAAEKAKAELEARDKADEVDLGALFDEVLAEETGKVGAGDTANDITAQIERHKRNLREARAMADTAKEAAAEKEIRRLRQQAMADESNLAPGTHINGEAERKAADRLELLLDQFQAGRDTPIGAARSAIRSVVEELRKPRTVISLKDVLETASSRLIRNYPAQSQVVDEVIDSLFPETPAGQAATPAAIEMRKMGADAFKSGQPRVVPDYFGASSSKEWYRGWDDANLAAPVRTAGQAAASAAINTGKGLMDAIDGLGKLFGSNGSRLSMGVSFDEDTYAKAKPLFAQAVAHFKDAGADIKEAMRAVVRMVLDKFGQQVTENMKPYIVRFMEDVKAGNVVYDEGKEAIENGNDGTRPATSGTGSGEQRDGDAGATSDGRPGGRAEDGNRAGDLGNGDRRDSGGKPLGTVAEEAASDGAGGKPAGGDQGRGGSVATSQGIRGSEPMAGGDRNQATVRDRPERPAAGSVAGNNPSKAPSTEGVSVSGKADFQISEDDALGEGGQKTKARNNIAAIRLLKKLAADDRRATPAEQKVLAKYVGWGGIKQIFDDAKTDWTKDRNDLKALLTPEEYAAARRSMLDAHYTSMDVVSGMWSAAAHLGFKGGRVLEPSVGVGNFFGLMPADVRARSSLYGVELDNITAQLAQNLYPSATVANMGFQDVELPANSFDMVVGNPPFGKQALYDKNHPELRSFSIHNFFFAKAIDKVRPGGILQMVVSHHLMDAVDSTARDYITARADLIGAIRLPDSAFRSNAGTDVVTDIIFLKKREPGAAPAGFDWSGTKAITLTHPKTGERFDFRINGYYDAHPEMIVGDQVPTGKMNNAPNAYNVAARAGESLYEGLGRAVSSLPRDVMTDSTKPLVEIATAESEVPEGTKVLGYYMAGSVVMQRQPDAMGKRQGRPVEFKDAKSPRRAEAMIKVRNALRDLMRAERADETDAVLATKRTRLNTLYDAFKKEYGYINQQTNRRAFRDDPDLPLLESLEPKFDPGLGADAAKKRGETARKPAAEKADIFTMRVLPAIKEVTTAATAQDALVVSLNMKGEVDPDYMAELYGKPWEHIRTELGALVFHNPNGGWEAADGYLSGNVKAKLKIAEAAAEADPQYQPNVEALRAVIPADMPALKISVRLGSPWIPSDVMEKLAAELWGDTGASIKFVKQVARWAVRSDGGDQTARNSTWGVTYGKLNGGQGTFTAPMVFEHVANNKAIVIKENVGDSENPVWKTNEPATEAIRAKAQEMAAKFKEWIWQDQDRRDRLAAIYNENYNTDRRRSYDGSHLTLPGSSSLIKLRRHQLNAVWRAIQDRVILLDHVVGAGKTYEMAAIAMELRRLGFSRKPMFVVPNSLVRQWRDEFYKLYPDANVLAATESDFEKKNRKRFMAKIATGDWDAVIVAHSSFKKVGMPYETEKAILDEQLKEISDAIEDMKRERGDKNVVRDMERIKIKLEERMKSLKDSGGKKDDAVSFDELGVDGLFVDEAHLFKNLFYYSQMRNVTGLGNPNGSGRAFDLFVKTRYLDQQYSGKALIGFATGTPVSNSLVEMFTMQRYLAWNKLKENGLHLLDAWAGVYGDVQQVYEVHPSGTGYRLSTRFAKFVNLPSLMELYRGFADVITMDDLKQQAKDAGGVFPVPKIKGLRPRNIVAERSDEQRMFFGVPEFGRDDKGGIAFKHEADLKVRKSEKDGKWYPWRPGGDKVGTEGFDTEEQATAERDTLIKLPVVGWNSGSILWKFENLKELTKNSKGKINALSITNEARKAGLDYRLINPMAPDFPGSKINLAVKEAVRIYHAWSADKGAQLMFCDLSVPKTARAAAASKERDAYVRGSDGGIQAVKATVVTIEGVEASFLAVKRGGKGAEGGFVLYDGLTGAHTGIAEHQKKDAVDALKARIEADGLGWLEDLQDRYGEITDADIADYKDAQGKEDDATEDEGDDGAISVSELMALAGGNTFSVYDDIKTKLIAAGIPENEIAFIHDFDTAIKKNGLFKKVKAGEIRILLGSTEKMGAGMNVQERLVALHHLDAPWRPSDLEQREGRIIRQGNKLYERDPDGFEVEVMRYGTRQTYDTRMWQIIEHKAAGVEQLRKAGDDLLEIDDVGGEAANAADMKAAASGNPLILDEIKLRNEAKSLEAQQFAYIQSKASMQDKVRWYRGAPDRAEDQIAEIQPFVDAAEKNPADPFSYTTPDGKVLTDKKDVALPLTTAFADAAQSKLGDTIDAGQYRGLLLRFRKGMGGIVAYLGSGAKPMPAADYGIEDKFSPSGIFTRLDNALERVKKTIADHRRMADQSVSQIPKLEAEIAKPFAKEDALKAARARHREVVSKLQKAGGGIELSPGMRAELDQAIAERTGKRGMESRSRGQGSASTESTRAIQSIVDKFLKQFAGAAALDIRVARTVADIPERFRPSPFAEGVFNDDAGLIYLVAMNLKHANGQVNAGRVWQVLMHEAVGHFGLAQMMGGRFGGILKEVMRAAKAKGGVGEDIYEPGHPDYATIEAVKLRYPGASDKELAQEVLARMAETDPGRTLFGYVRAVVRQWLRDMARAAGITLDVTTAELNDLVAQASRHMRRGGSLEQDAEPSGMAAASQKVGAGRTKYKAVDVASENFKRWFGDWEKAGQREFLSGEPVAKLTGQEFQKSAESLVDRSAESLVDRVAKFFAEVGGKATHPEIGEVALTRRGVHDSISHGLGSKKAAAFAAVPDVIRRGVVIDFEKNWKGRGYDGYTIAAPISIAGEHYVAVAVVHRDQGTSRFYLQEVALTEKLREAVAFKTGSSADKSGEISGATPDGALKTLLSNIFTVKPVSKVVDADGNPLRVYHGTAEDITEFDPSLTKVTEGVFLTPSKKSASTYANGDGRDGSNVMPLYVAMRNPKIIDVSKGDYYNANSLNSAMSHGEYDGVMVFDEDGNLHVVVARAATQIKSAISNTGAFDPSNPSILESRRAPTAGQPKEPRTGMLDTVLRKLGGEAAAKITGPAYDKLTAYLGGKVPEGVKAGMVSDYGLDESYIDRRTGMQTEQQKAARQTKTFVEGLMDLDRAQSRVAYQWLNNRGAEADRLMAQLPPESQQVLKDIKAQIAKLTIEAVRLGQLDAETASRNFLAYLHRSYAKYDLNTDDKTWKAERAKAIKILGDQYKGRGLKMEVDPDRIHSAPGWWEGEMKGKRVKVLKNDAGRFAFVADGTAIPPTLAGYKLEGVWEIRARKADNRIALWRDFTQDERTMMGELDEAKYAVARTLFMMNRDIEVGRFHEWVADEYAKTPEEADEEGLQMADASDSMMRAFKPDEWVTVPTTKVTGAGVFKYGALAGMVVPGPVWNDIRQISAGRFEPFGAAYASILRAWKLSKTALTPTTHVNNIMGNFVMADMHDVGARDAIAAVRLMVAAANGDKDAKAMLDRFEDSGATQGMFTTHELKKEVLEPLLQQLREEVGMADDEAAILKVSAIMSLVLHGQFGEAWAGAKAAAKQSTAGRITGAVVTKAQDYYQAEDSVFRLAAFLKSIDEGKTDQEAGKLARKAFLDYHINAPWINAMRGTAMPFIAFAYRAIPMLTETAAKKPWKIAKYMLVAGGLNALAYAMLGADADEDKERAYLPDEKAGRLWGIVPKLIRMPWNRESKLRDGKTTSDPVFLDVRRWIPVGDVVDYGQDKTALPLIPQPLIPGGPLIMAAEFMVNKSAFTGKELTKETDTWVEKAAKVGGHFYKGFAPNVPIPYSGTWAGTKIDNAIKGKEDPLGRAYPVPEAIASGFGLKLERYPVDTLQRNSVLDMKGKLRELDDEKRQAARDYGRQGMTKRELDEKVAEIVVKKNAAVEEFKAKERRAIGSR